MRIAVLLAALVFVIGCRTTPEAQPAATGAVDQEAIDAGCATKSFGGQRLSRPDGARLWFKDVGLRDAPVLLFVHGGPGYNSFTFEKAVGAELEAKLRVIYFDQRGSGRSWRDDGRTPALGMKPTLNDLEALRQHLGIERWFLAGHSFGGVVAAEYARAHPDRTRGVIQIETGNDVGAALQHQVDALARLAPQRFPEHEAALKANATSDAPVFEKMSTAYGILNRLPLQAALHYASPDAQARMEQWDADSGLLACGNGAVARAFTEEGYLGNSPPHAQEALPVPGVLFGGRRSEVIGAENLEQAALAWRIPLRWFEKSGHFVYLEEPEAFSVAVMDFIGSTAR